MAARCSEGGGDQDGKSAQGWGVGGRHGGSWGGPETRFHSRACSPTTTGGSRHPAVTSGHPHDRW
jgi:hypothetical protein